MRRSGDDVTAETAASVLVTRAIPDAGMEILAASGCRVIVAEADPEAPLAAARLRELAPAADVILSLLTEGIDEPLLALCPRLRGIANMAVGFDNVDIAAAGRLGIPVSNTPGILTDTVADLTWALILGAARRVGEAERYLRSGRWRTWGPSLMLGEDVSPGGDRRPKVLGVVGFGRIGSAVARRAAGFDMRVVAHDPRHQDRIRDAGATPLGLGELLAVSDVVSLHLPLRPETRHLVGADELRTMKPSAVLVNTSRGPLVDERALAAALRDGWIGAAGLDVFESEPSVAPELLTAPNALLLPHVGSASRATRGLMAETAARNAVAHARGERAPDVVDPTVYASAAWAARRETGNGRW